LKKRINSARKPPTFFAGTNFSRHGVLNTPRATQIALNKIKTNITKLKSEIQNFNKQLNKVFGLKRTRPPTPPRSLPSVNLTAIAAGIRANANAAARNAKEHENRMKRLKAMGFHKRRG
jgi:hypothetical protein